MWKTAYAALLLSFCAAPAATLQDRLIDVGGHKVHIRIAQPSAPKGPPIVFESGLGDTAAVWNSVIALLPPTHTIVAYDRPALGKSDPDGQPPRAEHIARVLHATLAIAGLNPPYLLVGHSWGGPRVRMFAALYPAETAGLVLVDPTDFTLTPEREMKEIFGPIGLTPADREAFFTELAARGAGAPKAVQDEIAVAHAATEHGYPDFRDRPMPDVPVVILIAQRNTAGFSPEHIPFDVQKLWRQNVQARVASFTAWAATLSEVTVILTPNSAHYIQLSEPDLVRTAIERVATPDPLKRLERAFNAGGKTRLTAEFAVIRQTYPPSRWSPDALKEYGRELVEAGKTQAGQAILDLKR